MGKIANRESLVFGELGQLSQAILQFHGERTLHKWTPITRFESQRNERRVYEDRFFCVLGGDMTVPTEVIRIAAMTLASD